MNRRKTAAKKKTSADYPFIGFRPPPDLMKRIRRLEKLAVLKKSQIVIMALRWSLDAIEKRHAIPNAN